MATERRILRCNVCSTRIATRTLIGHLDTHPIFLSCPKCGIDISGSIKIHRENASYSFSFINSEDVTAEDSETANFYIEISGELLTPKMSALPTGEIPEFNSPFFRAIEGMGESGYKAFMQCVIEFIYLAREKWPELKRINELWSNGNIEYCKEQLRTILPPDGYAVESRLDVLTGMKHANVNFFGTIIPDNFFENDASAIRNLFGSLAETKGHEILQLSRHFAGINRFAVWRRLFVERIDHFIRIFPQITPIFSVPYYKASPESLYAEMGIHTADYRMLGNFFVDTYENLIEMSDGVVATNNLIHRGNFDAMRPIRKDVKTLHDFSRLQKGDRLKFLQFADEDLGDCFGPFLNNKIRNSFGHTATRFEPISQRLDFYSRPGQVQPELSKTLAEFSNDCRMMLLGLFRVMEINSWLERFFLMRDGESPSGKTPRGILWR